MRYVHVNIVHICSYPFKFEGLNFETCICQHKIHIDESIFLGLLVSVQIRFLDMSLIWTDIKIHNQI